MATSREERDRILRLVEEGRVNALEAGQLLDALESEHERPFERKRERILRIRATTIDAKRQRVNVVATLPVSVIKTSLRLGAHILPQLSHNALTDLLRDIEEGASGRLLDLQDLEKGERIEVFVD